MVVFSLVQVVFSLGQVVFSLVLVVFRLVQLVFTQGKVLFGLCSAWFVGLASRPGHNLVCQDCSGEE